MINLKPDMYKKDVYSINYKKLKKLGIKVLLFDFDNTLIEMGNYDISKKTIQLFNELRSDFIIYVVSNSIHVSKLKKVTDKLEVPYIKDSRKPFKKGFKKLKLKSIQNSEIAMIGDQIMTDVLGGKRMNYFTVLVDPINYNEMLFTKINRLLEKREFKKNNMKRGGYYD